MTHRDLKPENIVFSSEGQHAQLIDFGSATVSKKPVAKFVGTANYLPPEVIRNQPSSHPSDLWALGCVIFEMLEGVKAFDQPSEFLTWNHILTAEVQCSELCQGEARDLCQQLLQKEPAARLGARNSADLKQHPFFQAISWPDLPTTDFTHSFLEDADGPPPLLEPWSPP